MIKSFIFENFKSFKKTELNLEAITSLIGSNSSGKSNAIEGIQILAESAIGLDLSVILDGTRNNDSHVRGGSKACCRFNTSSFKLGCMIDLDEKYDLLYYIRISTSKRVWVEEEALYKVKNGKTSLTNAERIFRTKQAEKDSGDIRAEYADKKAGRNPDIICMRVSSVLAQLKSKLPQNTARDAECLSYINLVLDNLKGIFVLNPIPTEMRDYVRATDSELKEKYKNSLEVVDAKRLSDGTLRCIAIIAAILTIPENSVLVIEEIDNGIHPARVQALIESLDKLGKDRKIDLILTTHNPVLLNKYDKEKLLGVSVVYRDKESGASLFIPLVEIEKFQDIFVQGGVGDAMIDDSLIRLIKEPVKSKDYSWLGV